MTQVKDYRINGETFRIFKRPDGKYVIGLLDGYSAFNSFAIPYAKSFEEAQSVLLDQIVLFSSQSWKP